MITGIKGFLFHRTFATLGSSSGQQQLDWATIVFEYEGNATVRDRYYKKKKLTPVINTKKQTISLNNYTFDYSVLQNGDIILRKTSMGRTEEIKFIKQAPQAFELMKREFNWIQEYPYNR